MREIRLQDLGFPAENITQTLFSAGYYYKTSFLINNILILKRAAHFQSDSEKCGNRGAVH